MFRRIVVATDFSETAAAAARYAASIARTYHGTVELVSVWHVPAELSSEGALLAGSAIEESRRATERQLAIAADALGFTCTTKMLEGEPDAAIVAHAQRLIDAGEPLTMRDDHLRVDEAGWHRLDGLVLAAGPAADDRARGAGVVNLVKALRLRTPAPDAPEPDDDPPNARILPALIGELDPSATSKLITGIGDVDSADIAARRPDLVAQVVVCARKAPEQLPAAGVEHADLGAKSPLDPGVQARNHAPDQTWDPMIDYAMMCRNVRHFMSLFHSNKCLYRSITIILAI